MRQPNELGGKVFRNPQQVTRLSHGDPPPSGADQPAVFPGTQRSADGKQRRPGHLRQILPGQRKIDLNSPFDLAAGLLRQPQQRSRDPPLDAFGHQLSMLTLKFVQTVRNHSCRVDGNRGELPHQLDDPGAIPRIGLGRLDGARRDRIDRVVGEGGDAAERLAPANEAQDDLMPFGRDLRELHAAATQHVEESCPVTFAKERSSRASARAARMGRHLRQRRIVQPAKQRHVREQLCIVMHGHTRHHTGVRGARDL